MRDIRIQFGAFNQSSIEIKRDNMLREIDINRILKIEPKIPMKKKLANIWHSILRFGRKDQQHKGVKR